MINKIKICLLLCGMIFLVLILNNCKTKTSGSDRPNIIIIMSDDMGYSDIGCFGSEIKTPNLDKLAARGIRFTQFYNTGRCCPTRASLLTGLYPHQAGVGHMADDGSPELGEGYARDLNRNCVTIAEALKPAGYKNYMVGKWHVAFHVTPAGPEHNWPLQRGFDKFYGTITGAGSFYDPGTLTRDNQAISPFNDPEYQPETFYYTDAISDHAVRYINEHDAGSSDKPFFMYVAYTAAHWPMHALEKDIAKYLGKYDAGYEAIRNARLEKMEEIGLIDPDWTKSEIFGNWEEQDNKDFEARNMEVYAAMIDNMDQGIGRICDALKENGQFENTVILFLQDNGGCAEDVCRWHQTFDTTYSAIPYDAFIQDVIPRQTRDGRSVLRNYDAVSGPENTYVAYREPWANVSNSPFRRYKHWVHEGGISTPLIAHWPDGIPGSEHGRLEHQPGHLIDLMATCVDLAGADYPSKVDGKSIHPMEGVSLVPAFRHESLEREGPIFWEHEGNRAIRDGKWKLVAAGSQGEWELYDMETDRTEMHDLSADHPDPVDQLSREWEEWAIRAKVKPWPWK